MVAKQMVPRPATIKKVQPREITLVDADLEDESDNTEPSGPPVVVAPEPVALPGILIGTPIVPPPAEILALAPPPAPISTVTLGAARPSSPAAVASREIAMSLPSQYEIDSERKSSPPVAERRKQLAKYVASAVGVAWFICTCAIGETALRSFMASMH
jgi:hypothetical protein